ncbi:putative dna repair helicase protein [Botrytis fragariae]|uniref:Putative dna repair helicase protein n=1 Tax=Botrytis fragariae TaxID=1964551 RepID=A0A8H6ELZ5_9HELO|nr:putative dna repair helicase protein [Botrytis fragariae]KAF5877049.1 putative dna repair helicase protein [Botrytis fragariae]
MCLLGDATGLVKTVTICEVWWMIIRKVPEEPLKPAPPKPKMLDVLPELIEQRRNGSEVSVYIDHGDERKSRPGTHKKIAGKLTLVVVITTLVTLRNRHGSSALKTFRLAKKSFAGKQATNDSQWEFNLAGLLECDIVDEAMY